MSADPLTFGIDYGTRKVSIAGMRGRRLHVIDSVDFGFSRSKASLSSYQLLPLLVSVVDQHLVNEHPAAIALESPIVGSTRNLQTTIKLAMVAGAIAAYLSEANLPMVLVAPSTWKKATVGHGNATKDDVLEWALMNWPQASDYDRADAIGLAVYAQHHQEGEPHP